MSVTLTRKVLSVTLTRKVLSVTLTRKPTTIHCTLHNYQLLSVHSAKYLGVYKLPINEYVDFTCKKANSALAFLRIETLGHDRAKSKPI